MKVFQFAVLCCFYLCIAGNANFTAYAFQKNKTDESSNPFLKCWEIKKGDIQSFASDNENIIFQDQEGQIVSLDKLTKQELWKISFGNKTVSSILIEQNNIYIISNDKKEDERNNNERNDDYKLITVRKIDRASGIIEETIKFSDLLNAKYLITPSLKNIVFVTPDKKFSLSELSENKILWNKPTSVDVDSQNTYEITDKSIAISSQNKIAQYNLSDGSVIREIVSEKNNISAILINDDSLFWGDNSGKVFYFDSKANSNRQISRTGGKISRIKKFGNKILVASDDNFVQLISGENRKISWKRRLPGRITLQPRENKDSIILTTTAENEIYFLRKDNGKVFNQITLGETEFISDFQISGNSLIVLTNQGLYNYREDCTIK